MKKEDLFDTLGDINKQYIEEAHATNKKKNTIAWAKWGTIAACLILLVFCVPMINRLLPTKDKTAPTVEPSPAENQNKEEVLQNKNEVQSRDKYESEKDALADYKGRIIDSYESYAEACYKAPDNNSFGISMPLRGALEEYGDSVRYMVVVDIFRNKEPIGADIEIMEAEMKRLENLGYDALIESGAEDDIYYLCIQATKEQIENFKTNKEYGYFIFIRSERIETNDAPADSNIEYNEAINDSDLTKDTSEFFGGSYTDDNGKLVIVITEDTPENRTAICKELGRTESNTTFVKGTYTLAYLTELQDKISNAMINKEIPFVVSSALMETTNNIVIGSTTTDETELAKVYALDTIGGAIKIEISTAATEDLLTVPKTE